MSINLGSPAIDAIGNLRGSDIWPLIMTAIEECARAKLHAALESSIADRVDATAYARGIHDVFVALSAASQRVNPRVVSKLAAKTLVDA
jgi:hypothetical protein